MDTLSKEASELLRHFDSLSAEDRERILELVKAMSQVTDILRGELQLPASLLV